MIGETGTDLKVIRNDEMTVEEIRQLMPECIILSPGPGRPEDAGVLIDVIKTMGKRAPILGVCLGHQSICKAFGAAVNHAKSIMHGKESVIEIDNTSPIFKGLGKEITAARYHSLAAVESTMPDCLKITGRADDGEIMAVQHRSYAVYGLQFHPESIMTPDGMTILKNFIEE